MQRRCLSKRNELKAWLWDERADYVLESPCPRCAVCGKPVSNPDMHEAIVPKRAAMGWPKSKRGLINHRYNCLLVCSGTGCHLQAHACPERMVAMLILMYGWDNINEWVETLPFKVRFVWHRGILNEEEANATLNSDTV